MSAWVSMGTTCLMSFENRTSGKDSNQTFTPLIKPLRSFSATQVAFPCVLLPSENQVAACTMNSWTALPYHGII